MSHTSLMGDDGLGSEEEEVEEVQAPTLTTNNAFLDSRVVLNLVSKNHKEWL